MIKIGVVNIDTSHPLAFSEILLKENRARYYAIYNDSFRGDDEVDGFISKRGLEKRCRSIEELADCVDIGFIQSCNWDDHIKQALPFIERGKPVFLDKPLVGSIADCRKVEELAAKGAVILGSSSARYAEEIVNFQALPEEEAGKTVNVFVSCGVDEFNYGVHAIEIIGGLLGPDGVSTRFAGRAEVDGKKCETFLAKFKNGTTAIYNTFLGTWQPFEVVIQTTKQTYQFRVDSGKIYKALLDNICDYMETGNSKVVSVKDMTNSIKLMLAGRLSREQGGIEVNIADIPEDDPGFDGSLFKKEYAAAANKMYL